MSKVRLLVNLTLKGKFYSEGQEIDEKDAKDILGKAVKDIHYIMVDIKPEKTEKVVKVEEVKKEKLN